MQQTRLVDLDDEILARVSPQKIKIGSLAKALGHAPKVIADRCLQLRMSGYGLMVSDPDMGGHITHANRLVRVSPKKWERVQKRAIAYCGLLPVPRRHEDDDCDPGRPGQLTPRMALAAEKIAKEAG